MIGDLSEFTDADLEWELAKRKNNARNESIRENLDRLKKLKDGWMDGDGVAFDESGLDWLTRAVEEHYPEDCFFPCFFPTLKGKVLAEWFFDDGAKYPFAPSLEIDLSQKIGDWHLLNLQTNAESERTFLLDSAEGWMDLAYEIRKLK